MSVNTFKIYSLLSVIVINLFLVLAFSIFFEYASLGKRVQNAEINISTALDMALEAVVESEEMFSKDYAEHVTSRGVESKGVETSTTEYINQDYLTNTTPDKLFGAVVFWNDENKSLHHANTFYVAWFYDEYGRFPKDETELDTFASTKLSTSDLKMNERSHSANLYQWLFGKSGSSYQNPALHWANRNISTRALYNHFDCGPSTNAGREPVTELKEYYDAVGKYQLSYAYVKIPKGTGYELSLEPYPTLAAMGLNLDNTYNSIGGSKMMDEFVSSVHFAKTYNLDRDSAINSNRAAWSQYYLTPVALGVTYVPQKALKSTFIADLDYLVRLSKVSFGGGVNTLTGLQQTSDDTDMAEATGCLIPCNPTRMVHHSAGTTGVPGADCTLENIINDGEIEYDLDTAQVKIDYFCVNFNPYTPSGNHNKEVLMGKLRGLTAVTNDNRTEDDLRVLALQDYTRNYDTYVRLSTEPTFSETQYRDSVYTNIVARVTCKIKLHIPYKGTAFDWFRYMTDNPAVANHYGLKLWNPDTNSVYNDQDGVWYTYTTYYMVKR